MADGAARRGKRHPAVVVEFARRAVSLIGNASHCAIIDLRKGLLSKVSAECLDLMEDPKLFVPGSSDLFGKKFKKAVLKDLKLSKEMDNLVGSSRHGNGRYKQVKPFHQQPRKGPGQNPRSWGQNRWNQNPSSQQPFRGGFSQRRGKPHFFPGQGKQN
jgi:hypothetical protein